MKIKRNPFILYSPKIESRFLASTFSIDSSLCLHECMTLPSLHRVRGHSAPTIVSLYISQHFLKSKKWNKALSSAALFILLFCSIFFSFFSFFGWSLYLSYFLFSLSFFLSFLIFFLSISRNNQCIL